METAGPSSAGEPAAPAPASYSLAICTYRRSQVCVATLQALLPQLPPGGEVIVVDQTLDGVLDAFVKEHASFPCPLKLIHLTRPNIVAARNAALAAARHPILIYVDDDILPLPGLVEGHLAAYSDPRVGGVAGRILDPGQTTYPPLDPRALDPVEGWLYTRFDHETPMPVQTVRGCNMSFRRDLLLEVGGTDTQFRPPFFFREDSDTCSAIRGLGYIVQFAPRAALVHLGAAAGGTRASEPSPGLLREELRLYRRLFCHWRDNLYFIHKHFTGRRRWRFIGRHCRDYVGCSRWPWRLAAKYALFLAALAQARWWAWRRKSLRRPTVRDDPIEARPQ